MLKCIEKMPMQAEEWEAIKRIFDSAVKLSPAERSGYLAAACAHNGVLLQTVGELLQAHDEASGFLDESTKPSMPPVFEAGQLVAERFRIIRLISRGGMGEVYETFDERLSVRLALKTLRPEFAGDLDSLERFRREIRVTREMSHPNLCRVYELVEHNLPPDDARGPGRVATCLTMQLMSGETLQQYLFKSGRLSPEAALPLIKQIAGAIGVLHENGIVHRDLKPSNVMITPSGDGELRAIVMDFGLAKPFNGEKEIFKSRSDFNAGAPFFLAPELVRGERPSIASDIYAFGLIVDEMVTGGGAFSGDTVESILYQKLWSDPNDPLARAPALPANWCQTIRRCLHRNPAKRPSSALQVTRGLHDTSAETQAIPQFYQAIKKFGGWLPSIRGRHPSRRSLLLTGCAVLLISGGTFFGILGTRPLNTSVVTFEFENMTGKAENEYLSKGVTREVERRLLQIPGVTVMPFHDVRPREARVKLDARFSLEGQLQSSKDVTRLSVEVTENSTGKLICCANAFEKNTADTLEMQSAISTAAVEAMRDAVLLPNANNAGGALPGAIFSLLNHVPLPGWQKALTPPTSSSTAMQFSMRGRSLWEQRTLPSLLQARDVYERAIKEDSNYALAYADLAGVERTLMQYSYYPRAELLKSATVHAQQAVEKGPGYAESYAALAAAKQYSWDWKGAEETYKRALAINPKLANTHRQYGGFLIQFGRFEEGLKEERTSISLDPFDFSDRLILGTYLCLAGEPEEAVTYLNTFLAEKDFHVGHNILGMAYAQLALKSSGQRKKEWLNKALKEAAVLDREEHSAQQATEDSASLFALLYALAGDKQNARKYIEVMIPGEKAGVVDPVDLAMPYVALGDSRSALDILGRAVAAKDSGLMYLKVDPFFQPLKDNIEFQGLIGKIGF